MMDEALADIEWQAGQGYIDDIICGSDTFERHVQDLQRLFDRMKEWRISAKLTKCQFFRNRLLYLGHIVTFDGIQPNNEKVNAISKMKPLQDIYGLRRFLGMTSYYRKFIRKYADIAEPLFKINKSNTTWRWDHDCQQAFDDLKERLMTAPILQYLDYAKPFEVHTDASNFAIGAPCWPSWSTGSEW